MPRKANLRFCDDGSIWRICAGCDTDKPLDAYSPSRAGAMGRKSRCRKCSNAADNAFRKKDPVRQAKLRKARRLRKPEAYAAIEKRAKANRAGKAKLERKARYWNEREQALIYNQKHYAENRGYHLGRSVAWQKANPGKVLSYVRASKNKRRALKAGSGDASFTSTDWKVTLLLHDHRCAWCLKPFKRLEQDHVTPLARQGAHTADNIVPACRTCNAVKGSKTILECLLEGRLT